MKDIKDIIKAKKEKKEADETNPKSFDLLFSNSDNTENTQLSPHEQTLQKALDELFSTEGIDLKSDINAIQVSALTRGYIFADVYKSKHMNDLVKHVLELSVSKARKGRGEFVKILQNNVAPNEDGGLKIVRRRLLD